MMSPTLATRVLGAGVGMVLLLGGCAQQPTLGKLLVLGSDMGSQYENVLVTRGGQPVTTATVSVNGTQLTLADVNTGEYYGSRPSQLPVGSQLDLLVTDGSQHVEAIGKVPEIPAITAPVAGATINASQPLMVSWTSTTSPDTFELEVDQGPGSPVYDATMGGASRTTTIPANSLDPGYSNGNLNVFAYDLGNDRITGDAAAGSAMNIRAYSVITFDTSP